jgi:hypothetical protein
MPPVLPFVGFMLAILGIYLAAYLAYTWGT